MPTRSQAQRIGDAAELLIRTQIDRHPSWLARSQDKDFGVDLEAELAPQNDDGQRLSGRLIKIQIKGSESLQISESHVSVSIERKYLEYVTNLKLPVILVVVDLPQQFAWWVWLQGWLLENEQALSSERGARTVTVKIPLDQTLSGGLDLGLQRIARGEDLAATVLALRDLISVATSMSNQALYEGALGLLDNIDSAGRPWAIGKIVDALVGLGPNAGAWQTHRFIPQIVALVERAGSSMTSEQLLRLVARDDSYSRAGMTALARFYDTWGRRARELGLASAFREKCLEQIAWYCDMREYHSEMSSMDLWRALSDGTLTMLRFGRLEIPREEFFQEFIRREWPTRGDSAFIDCLAAFDSDEAELAVTS